MAEWVQVGGGLKTVSDFGLFRPLIEALACTAVQFFSKPGRKPEPQNPTKPLHPKPLNPTKPLHPKP